MAVASTAGGSLDKGLTQPLPVAASQRAGEAFGTSPPCLASQGLETRVAAWACLAACPWAWLARAPRRLGKVRTRNQRQWAYAGRWRQTACAESHRTGACNHHVQVCCSSTLFRARTAACRHAGLRQAVGADRRRDKAAGLWEAWMLGRESWELAVGVRSLRSNCRRNLRAAEVR